MTGREDKKSNDLFFVCSLVELIARKTKNKRDYVVQKIGRETMYKIFDLADVYHSYNIEQVSDEFIQKAGIEIGSFDNLQNCDYAIPTYWDIGKVYKRLILGVAKEKSIEVLEALFQVYNSFISDLIDDYNSSFYYENPQYILNTYLTEKIE